MAMKFRGWLQLGVRGAYFAIICCSCLCLQYIFFEKNVGKGEIDRNKQFLLFPHCFLPVWRTFCQFYQIWNCHLQILSVLKSQKFVVWEKVKQLHIILIEN